MITVVILITGNPLVARAAVNTKRTRGGNAVYRFDGGSELLHDPEDGAVALSKLPLDTIKL